MMMVNILNVNHVIKIVNYVKIKHNVFNAKKVIIKIIIIIVNSVVKDVKYAKNKWIIVNFVLVH